MRRYRPKDMAPVPGNGLAVSELFACHSEEPPVVYVDARSSTLVAVVLGVWEPKNCPAQRTVRVHRVPRNPDEVGAVSHLVKGDFDHHTAGRVTNGSDINICDDREKVALYIGEKRRQCRDQRGDKQETEPSPQENVTELVKH